MLSMDQFMRKGQRWLLTQLYSAKEELLRHKSAIKIQSFFRMI